MEKLNSIIKQHINKGLYQGVEWKINHKDKCYQGKQGYLDLSINSPIKTNSIYRIWSMTKPIVSVVILQLIEENKIRLDDALNFYLPIFNDLKVLKDENNPKIITKNVSCMPNIKNLLLHTAGFSYNFFENQIANIYSKKKLFYSSDTTLEEEINILATCPLLYEPSKKWHYSVSIDILARIIEVVSNDTLQNVLKKRIFKPLGMYDTDFIVSKDKRHRLMKSYEYIPNERILSNLSMQNIGVYGYPENNSNYARGGHGLYSSLEDYFKFAEMLLTGKSKSGKVILSKKMLNLATRNHLSDKFLPIEIKIPGDEDLENDFEPYGWGLGFRVLVDVNKLNGTGSLGEFGWSGAASTFFLVDPKESITAVLMTQVLNGDKVLRENFIEEIYKNL